MWLNHEHIAINMANLKQLNNELRDSINVLTKVQLYKNRLHPLAEQTLPEELQNGLAKLQEAIENVSKAVNDKAPEHELRRSEYLLTVIQLKQNATNK